MFNCGQQWYRQYQREIEARDPEHSPIAKMWYYEKMGTILWRTLLEKNSNNRLPRKGWDRKFLEEYHAKG